MTPDPLGSQSADPFGDPLAAPTTGDYFGMGGGSQVGQPKPPAPAPVAAPPPSLVQPAQAPAPDSLDAQFAAQQAQVQKLLADAESYLKTDVTKDPDVAGELANYKKDRKAEREESQALRDQIQSFLTFSKPPPTPPDASKELAPEMRDFVVKTTPWLTILSAIGGKVAGLSGLNMLGAMNGMLKGSLAGSQKAFDAAYQRYQDNWTRLQEDYRNKDAFYRSEMEMRKGQIDAQARALEAVATMAGEDLKGATTVAGMKSAHDKAMIALTSAASRLELTKQQMGERQRSQVLKIVQAYQKAEGAFPRNTDAKVSADKAFELLPQVLDEIKQYAPELPFPKAIAEWMAHSGSVQAQQFRAYWVNAKAIIMALETSGTGARSNMLLQVMIGKGVPTEIYNMGPAEVDVLSRQLKALLDNSWETQTQNMEMYRKLAKAEGFDIPQSPEYKLPASQLPTDMGGTAAPSGKSDALSEADAIVGFKP
jgi:hypothetical protein